MNNKDLKKKRMMKYFIESAIKIIDTEGVDSVTIRKVADTAGYNSSTIYNYFENLEHLMFFTKLRYLRNYASRLENEFPPTNNALDRSLAVWRLFADESFKHADIFYSLFFTKYADQFNDSVKIFYEIFPEDLGKPAEELMPMLLERNIYQRDYRALELCAKEGIIDYVDLHEINEMIMLIYQSMLIRKMNSELPYTHDEIVNVFIKYVRNIFRIYILC